MLSALDNTVEDEEEIDTTQGGPGDSFLVDQGINLNDTAGSSQMPTQSPPSPTPGPSTSVNTQPTGKERELICHYLKSTKRFGFPGTAMSKRKKADRLTLLDGSGTVHKRGPEKRKVIRFRHYGMQMDPNNYARERLMLFIPWREEQRELIDINPIEVADIHQEQIKENAQPYFANHDVDDDLLNDLADDIEAHSLEDEDDYQFIGDEEDVLQDEEYRDSGFADAFGDSRTKSDKFLPPRMIKEPEYLQMMRSLNENQRRFVLNTLHCLKN